MPVRAPRRRSNRSAELTRVAALETDSSFSAAGRERRAERALEALGRPRDRDLGPRGAHGPARRGHPRLAAPAVAGAVAAMATARPRSRRKAGRVIEDRKPQHDIRRGRADGTGAGAIVAADGHRLAFDGGAGHDATEPARGAAPAPRRGDRRGGRRPAPARLRAVVPQLRRALRARVGARPRDGQTPDYTGPYAPTPHPLETVVSLLAVPFGEGGDAIMLWLVLLVLRRARVARLPARRRAVLAAGRRRRGARGADAAGARARRPARVPGHAVRRADPVGGAARGAAAAVRRAGARPAGRGRADAPGGVGAGRALRALRLAGRLDARARRSTRA